jgi:hypothetical protein
MRQGAVAFVSGVLFALGLVVGGMTQPAKVQGFLDVTGAWDPTLMFVMGGALLVYGVLYRLIMKRPAPLLEAKFHVPSRRDLDGRLIGGAALFGVGWGLAGYCPGPGLASLGGGVMPLTFVVAMIVGMLAQQALDDLLQKMKRRS